MGLENKVVETSMVVLFITIPWLDQNNHAEDWDGLRNPGCWTQWKQEATSLTELKKASWLQASNASHGQILSGAAQMNLGHLEKNVWENVSQF